MARWNDSAYCDARLQQNVIKTNGDPLFDDSFIAENAEKLKMLEDKRITMNEKGGGRIWTFYLTSDFSR
ncbi:hypothetical protein FBU30_002756, partial [Linnemannia zychae]